MPAWVVKAFLWVKVGLPFASRLYYVLRDGRVTKMEAYSVIDDLFDGRSEFILWGKK